MMGRTEPSSYRQVRVGQLTVGMTGLDETFAALREAGRPPDETAVDELLARARRHNYIPSAVVDEYRDALLREYRRFCLQAGCACTVNYGSWRGRPRETIPWYPTIHAELCDGCAACLRFCTFGVLAPTDDGRVEVVEPFRCQVGCSACAHLCKPGALTFPPRQVLEPFGGE